ncbi:MAG: hypothetical protein V4574_12305 [Pseudomonadota bacterium]
MEDDAPHPLSVPQSARYTLRVTDKFILESEVRVTPLGLFAIGGMVAAILIAAAPIVRARGAHALPPPRD